MAAAVVAEVVEDVVVLARHQVHATTELAKCNDSLGTLIHCACRPSTQAQKQKLSETWVQVACKFAANPCQSCGEPVHRVESASRLGTGAGSHCA